MYRTDFWTEHLHQQKPAKTVSHSMQEEALQKSNPKQVLQAFIIYLEVSASTLQHNKYCQCRQSLHRDKDHIDRYAEDQARFSVPSRSDIWSDLNHHLAARTPPHRDLLTFDD